MSWRSPSSSHRRGPRALSVVLVSWLGWVGGVPALAAAQGDWDRAEDEAIGDQSEGVYQAGGLAEAPEGEAEGEGRGPDDDASPAGAPERRRDDDDDREDGEDRQDREDDDADRPLFGSLDRGGAIEFFGDLGTFFGPVNIASGVGTVGQTDAFSFTPWFGVAYALTDAVTIGGQWGFSMLAHGDVNLVAGTALDAGVALTAGNPVLSGRWLPSGGGGGPITWGIDLEIAFPASRVGNVAELTGVNSAIGSRGAWDLWHWANGVFGLVPGGFLRWQVMDGFQVEFEADLGLLLGVADGQDSTIGVLQIGIDASYRIVDALGVGVRLWTVFDGAIFPGRETAQLSLAPYVPLFFGPLWVRAEFILNLTAPYGTSFSDGKWWGTRLVAGVDL